VGQVFAPAEAASIPSLVSREQIQGAMSLFMTTVIFTLMLGSVLAPVCLILFGDLVPFYIAAGLFALAALSCWRIGASLRAVEAGAGPRPTSSRSSRTASASSAGARRCAGG
jgi:hypothetical protein